MGKWHVQNDPLQTCRQWSAPQTLVSSFNNHAKYQAQLLLSSSPCAHVNTVIGSTRFFKRASKKIKCKASSSSWQSSFFLSFLLRFCGHVHFLPFPPERDYASLNITTCSQGWPVDSDFCVGCVSNPVSVEILTSLPTSQGGFHATFQKQMCSAQYFLKLVILCIVT